MSTIEILGLIAHRLLTLTGLQFVGEFFYTDDDEVIVTWTSEKAVETPFILNVNRESKDIDLCMLGPVRSLEQVIRPEERHDFMSVLSMGPNPFEKGIAAHSLASPVSSPVQEICIDDTPYGQQILESSAKADDGSYMPDVSKCQAKEADDGSGRMMCTDCNLCCVEDEHPVCVSAYKPIRGWAYQVMAWFTYPEEGKDFALYEPMYTSIETFPSEKVAVYEAALQQYEERWDYRNQKGWEKADYEELPQIDG